MVGDEWFEDPTRLLRGVLLVDDTAREAVTAAAELIWDDLLDAVETDAVDDALLIGLLPRQFRDRAVGDWRRWLATFTTVVWKLAQPAPPPPATMAEQLCVGALIGYTQTDLVDLARDGVVDLNVADDGIDLELWVEAYLADVDHELLYDPALDGIDDEVTDHQYGFGRMDYEGMFAVFNEHNDTFTGAPHPLASLRMTAGEWETEQRLQRAVAQASVAVARAAVAGAARIHLADDGVDVELVAHRVGNLLGLPLRTAPPTTIELVGPVDAAARDRLAGWLNHHNAG